MIKILMASSSAGKDYILKRMVNDYGIIPIISHTSRPMRINESNGREYYFISTYEFAQMIYENNLIEYRTYNTLVNDIPEVWYYGIAKQPFDSSKDYVVILDVQGCREFINYIGEDNVKVYYIYCDSHIRTERAKSRGGFDDYEWMRRLEDDAKVFSEENMRGIKYKTVINQYRNIDDVVKEIME